MPTFQASTVDLQPPVTSSASSSPINPNHTSRNELVSSSPTKIKNQNDEDSQEEPVPQSKTPSSSDMIYYYERLLPFRYIFQWLNHSPKPQSDFTMREFAYEYRSGAYQRYNSYPTLEDFKNSVIKANPTRFEVGAVYSINPKDRKTVPKSAMKPLEKELVFDIDLTDYDEIRTCCSKTDICIKCWQFITVATKILDKALRDDFGFENMIWVFSGRRGAHCWISDKRARILDESKRRAIVEYLDILKNKGSKRLNLRRPYHPHIERSFKILKNEFIPLILENQDPWKDEYEDLLKFPNPKVNNALKEFWKSKPGRSSFEKWQDIDDIAKKVLTKPLDLKLIVEAKQDLIIETMYPRLDVEVSRQMIHLLKSPFCIHPGTGNVCVPFDANKSFDPTTSPNLRQIQHEIEEWDSTHTVNPNDRKIHDYEKTSLKPYVELFGRFVNELLKTETNSVKREREEDNNLEF